MNDWQKRQAADCPCGGADDYCPCQNVDASIPKHYIAAGKQVLLNGVHFADAADIVSASIIVKALNNV